MPNYRLTFEVLAGTSIASKELRNIHAEMEKYLRTVLLPVGNKVQVRTNAVVTVAEEDLSYHYHQHDGTNTCDYCTAMADDQRN